MKVLAVYYDLPPEVIPYVKDRHDSFVERFGEALMPMDYATTDRLWVLATPWKCLLKLDIGWMEFSAKSGWWLDWVSIPGILESLEKRDDRNGIIAATIHDYRCKSSNLLAKILFANIKRWIVRFLLLTCFFLFHK